MKTAKFKELHITQLTYPNGDPHLQVEAIFTCKDTPIKLLMIPYHYPREFYIGFEYTKLLEAFEQQVFPLLSKNSISKIKSTIFYYMSREYSIKTKRQKLVLNLTRGIETCG